MPQSFKFPIPSSALAAASAISALNLRGDNAYADESSTAEAAFADFNNIEVVAEGKGRRAREKGRARRLAASQIENAQVEAEGEGDSAAWRIAKTAEKIVIHPLVFAAVATFAIHEYGLPEGWDKTGFCQKYAHFLLPIAFALHATAIVLAEVMAEPEN
eukprot:GHVO01027920.1.p1 GENE.GHVO01027920.1~~GHVO01027920.1.p1  ORF type:complete len:167 (+),score=21.71 GHVO01027920.1:26-502(+)